MALDILIVDDERDIRELVAGVLSDEGYECRTAGDSTSALAAVDARRPRLVLRSTVRSHYSSTKAGGRECLTKFLASSFRATAAFARSGASSV